MRPAAVGQRRQQLHDQVGFYLLPPEPKFGKKKSPVLGRRRNKNHLDVITEVSDESRTSTPNAAFLGVQDDFRVGLEPKLIR